MSVCIWRLPRQESIVKPSSYCPKCKRPIRFYDNIPLISYFLLKGQCRFCGVRISWEYPLVEAITAFVYLLAGWRIGPTWSLIAYLAFVSALIVIAFIDIHHYVIPRLITFPGIIIGFLISFFPFMDITPKESLMGIILCGVAFYLVGEFGKLIWKKEALGFGDVELIALIAAYLGWKGGLMTIFWGSLFGSIWGAILIISRKKTRMDIIPFGPFLCLGALLSLLYGLEILWWYQGLFKP